MALFCTAACVPLTKSNLQEPLCERPPVASCLPGSLTDAPFDTSSSKFLPAPTFLRIEPVVGFDRPDRNEYGAAFRDSLFGWLTTDIGTVVSFSLQETADVHAEVDVVCEDGAFGAVAVSGRQPTVAGFVANTERQGQSDVVAFQLERGVASDIQHIENVNSATAWDSHPTLSADGQILVFASDRPGGYGGTDLWCSFVVDGKFSEPVNCGPNVNTACHEITPHLTKDGWLLFSSNGHQTVGGYDVFRSKLKVEAEAQRLLCERPVNVGAPLNTAQDEIFPACSGQTMLPLYYSSDQKRVGDFDAYVMHELPREGVDLGDVDREFDITTTLPSQPVEVMELELREFDVNDVETQVASEMPEESSKKEERVDSIAIRGRVMSTESTPVVAADIEVSSLPNRVVVARTTTNTEGEYEVRSPNHDSLEVVISHPEVFPTTVVVAPELEEVQMPVVQMRRSMQLRIHFPTDDHSQPYETVLDTNGMSTQAEWTAELDKVAKDLLLYSDEIERVVLVGHTDDAASASYNLALGQRRVEFVVQQLISRGVPAEMLEAQSAGESQLLPRRKDESLQQWRLRCRRVELARIVR